MYYTLSSHSTHSPFTIHHSLLPQLASSHFPRFSFLIDSLASCRNIRRSIISTTVFIPYLSSDVIRLTLPFFSPNKLREALILSRDGIPATVDGQAIHLKERRKKTKGNESQRIQTDCHAKEQYPSFATYNRLITSFHRCDARDARPRSDK